MPALVLLPSDLDRHASAHGQDPVRTSQRFKSARVKGSRKTNRANVLLTGSHTSLMKISQGQTEEFHNSHYDVDSVSKSRVSGMLRRHFEARRRLQHGHFFRSGMVRAISRRAFLTTMKNSQRVQMIAYFYINSAAYSTTIRRPNQMTKKHESDEY